MNAETTHCFPELLRKQSGSLSSPGLFRAVSTHIWFFGVQSDFRQPPGYAIFPVLKVTGKLRPSFLKVKSSVYCSKHILLQSKMWKPIAHGFLLFGLYLLFICHTHHFKCHIPSLIFSSSPGNFSKCDDCFRKTYVKL